MSEKDDLYFLVIFIILVLLIVVISGLTAGWDKTWEFNVLDFFDLP